MPARARRSTSTMSDIGVTRPSPAIGDVTIAARLWVKHNALVTLQTHKITPPPWSVTKW